MHSHLATFAFQTVNFLVLAGVLRYWLYRPVQAMIARRQREVEAPLAAAAAERTKAAELRAEAERQHLAAAGERDRFLLEAGRDAESRRDQLLGEARRSADSLLKEGEAALARERTAAESTLQARAAELAAGIAGRLLTMSGQRTPPRICSTRPSGRSSRWMAPAGSASSRRARIGRDPGCDGGALGDRKTGCGLSAVAPSAGRAPGDCVHRGFRSPGGR